MNSWRYDNDAFASELKDTVSVLLFPTYLIPFYILIMCPCHLPFQPGSRVSSVFAEDKCFDDHASTGGITHEDYKAIYSQWHKKLATAAIGCLKSSEYMHTRAALIVLSRIVLVFPTQPKSGDQILNALGPLQNDDDKPDIRATAKGYASQLMKARDEGMW